MIPPCTFGQNKALFPVWLIISYPPLLVQLLRQIAQEQSRFRCFGAGHNLLSIPTFFADDRPYCISRMFKIKRIQRDIAGGQPVCRTDHEGILSLGKTLHLSYGKASKSPIKRFPKI